MRNCRLREISQFLSVCLNWLRLKCSRFACGISSSVFCFISICSKVERETNNEGHILLLLSQWPPENPAKQKWRKYLLCLLSFFWTERFQGNWWDSGLLRLFPTLISLPLSDLPYPQKEVLAFSNPHTSQLYLIYDVFILPRPQAVSLSNDWQQLWNEVSPKWPLIGMGCLSSQT